MARIVGVCAACLVFLGWSLKASAQQGAAPAEVREVMARLEAEPGVGRVIKQAVAFYQVSGSTFEEIRSRATWKHALPKLSGEYRDSTLGIFVEGFDFLQLPDDQFTQTNILGGASEWKVAATWDLPAIVYNPEVLDTYTVLQTREQVIKEVVRLYYQRRRALIDLWVEPPRDVRAYMNKQIYIEELTALLDSMTGGAYAASLEPR